MTFDLDKLKVNNVWFTWNCEKNVRAWVYKIWNLHIVMEESQPGNCFVKFPHNKLGRFCFCSSHKTCGNPAELRSTVPWIIHVCVCMTMISIKAWPALCPSPRYAMSSTFDCISFSIIFFFPSNVTHQPKCVWYRRTCSNLNKEQSQSHTMQHVTARTPISMLYAAVCMVLHQDAIIELANLLTVQSAENFEVRK